MLSPRFYQQLDALIRAPSVTCTQPALDQTNLAVIQWLASWFEDAGFACEEMPVAPGKANLLAVRAAHTGQRSGGLVLSGHTDTVPCDPQLWHSDPFRLQQRDDRLYGLGTADMKSFFALVLEALQPFRHTPFRAPLVVVGTCDEETSMAGARALVEQSRQLGRFVLIGEPTSLKPARVHKGVMLEEVVIHGQSGHSSDPSLGRNALEAMSEVLQRLLAFRDELMLVRQPLFAVPYATMNLGCIHGGDNPNRICGQCRLQFDVRPLPGQSIAELRARIGERLAGVASRYGVTLDYHPATRGTPALETPADSPLVRQVEALTGQQAQTVAFGTEGPYFRQLGLDVVVLGAGNIEQAHQPDEYLELGKAATMVDYLRQLIDHYCVQGHDCPLPASV